MNMYDTLAFFIPMWVFGFIGFIVGHYVGRENSHDLDKPQKSRCYRNRPFQRLLSDFWQRLINPCFWLMITKYNADLDKFISSNLDNITNISSHTCNINGKLIWIKNYPYGYADLWQYPLGTMNIRPSISTIKKLRKAVIKNSLEQILEDA